MIFFVLVCLHITWGKRMISMVECKLYIYWIHSYIIAIVRHISPIIYSQGCIMCILSVVKLFSDHVLYCDIDDLLDLFQSYCWTTLELKPVQQKLIVHGGFFQSFSAFLCVFPPQIVILCLCRGGSLY